MIFEGYNKKIITKPDINRDLLKLEGYLSDEVAKESLSKFLRYNLGFTIELLTGHKVFPFQELMIKGMFLKDFYLAIAGRGLSKCKVWDSRVLTDKGIKKFIDVEIGDMIFADKQPQKVLNKWVNEPRSSIKLKTEKGYVCEGVLEHKILTFDKENLEFSYKNLENINIGDLIPIRKGPNYWGNEDISQMFYNGDSEDFYYYLGVLLGDGCIKGGRNRIGITSEDNETISFIRKFYSKLKMHINFNIKKSSKGASFQMVSANEDFAKALEFCGFNKEHYAHQKLIPDCIYKAKKELVKAFLQGLLDTDGFCSIQKHKNKDAVMCSVGYTSASFKLIKEVQNLLLNFGVISDLHICHHGGEYEIMGVKCNTQEAYSLSITGYTNIKTFRDEIGFRLSRKQNNLDKFINEYKYKIDYYTNYVPIGAYLKKNYRTRGNQWQAAGITKIHKNVSVERLKYILDKKLLTPEDEIKVKEIVNGNYYFDKVESLEYGECITVDVTVDKEECYWSDGFINHNSWTASQFVWLYALMNPGVKIGIISAGFRQSKILFQNIENFANSPGGELLKQCFTADVSHGNDQWLMNIGRSVVVALPLGNGAKLRGFRFNVIVIDELLLMPESVINEVILPFLSVNFDPVKRKEITEAEDEMIAKGMMGESDRTQFMNPKFIGLSSASYQFENLYKIYKSYYDKLMTPGLLDETGKPVDASGYGIMQLSWEVAPKHLYSEETIAKFKSQLSEAQFNREFNSIFTTDSGGYFSKRKMDLCTVKIGQEPTIEIYGDKDSNYLLAIDPAFSQAESSDHFAMGLFKLNEKDRTSALVHNYAMAGGQLQDRIKYLAYLLKNFNIVYIIIDNAGQEFIDECNNSVIFHEEKLNLEFFDADFENPDYLKGLRKSKDSYDPKLRRICHSQYFNSSWLRQANELLAANFDHMRIHFASPPIDDKFKKMVNSGIDIGDLVYSKGEQLKGKAKIVDFIDHQVSLIDLTKNETALIEVKSSPNGNQTFQLPQNLRRSDSPDRARRDNYTTLLLGSYGCKVYFDLCFKELEETQATFRPFFIG